MFSYPVATSQSLLCVLSTFIPRGWPCIEASSCLCCLKCRRAARNHLPDVSIAFLPLSSAQIVSHTASHPSRSCYTTSLLGSETPSQQRLDSQTRSHLSIRPVATNAFACVRKRSTVSGDRMLPPCCCSACLAPALDGLCCLMRQPTIAGVVTPLLESDLEAQRRHRRAGPSACPP